MEDNNDKVEYVDAELMPLDDIEEMTYNEYRLKKQQLEQKRTRLSLMLDGRKLEQAMKLIERMDMVLERLGDSWDAERLSTKEVKELAEAYDRLSKSLSYISRLDALDGSGGIKKGVLTIEWI